MHINAHTTYVACYVLHFFKGEQGSPNEVLQRLLESDQFAGISSRITSTGTELVV